MTPEQTAGVIGLATLAGAGVKHLIPQIPNRFIPVITFAIVFVCGLWASGWAIDLDTFLILATQALGPTGAHQMLRSATGDRVTINGQTL